VKTTAGKGAMKHVSAAFLRGLLIKSRLRNLRGPGVGVRWTPLRGERPSPRAAPISYAAAAQPAGAMAQREIAMDWSVSGETELTSRARSFRAPSVFVKASCALTPRWAKADLGRPNARRRHESSRGALRGTVDGSSRTRLLPRAVKSWT
jgi:hypothetical protein